MHRKQAQEIYKDLTLVLTEKKYLRRFSCSKKKLLLLIPRDKWIEQISKFELDQAVSASEILSLYKEAMAALTKEDAYDPENG